jgi:hypothetical protein
MAATVPYSGMKEKLIQAHVASHMQKPFKPRAWLRHTPLYIKTNVP